MGRIDDIAEHYLDSYASADPVAATGMGVPGHDAEMTDFSPEGFAVRADLDRRTLSEVAATTTTDEREQVVKDAMLERIGLAQEMYDAGATTSDLNVIASPLQEARQVFDLMPTDTEQDWRNIAIRLTAFPVALEGLRRTLAESAAEGRVAARRQVLACAEQCRSWTEPDDDVFASLLATANVGEALRADLERGAKAARTALGEFERFLRSELAGRAPTTDAVGRERYQLGSRYFLGAEVDLEETYAWGWEELARIETEMARVADTIVPGGSIDDAVAALDADPDRQLGDATTFQAWMQDLADRTVDALAGVHFDIPDPVRRLECRLAPTSDGGIYYTGPSEDFSRAGRMWWSVPKGVTTFATWRETTTVYHEGVPGHHLQIGQTVYRANLLNRWQRLMCWVSGHGEGWALYAERLMAELGYLDDPGARLGMLDQQAFRAARVIVDIGMHLELTIPAGTGWHEGERWSPPLGFAFLREHSRMPEEILRFELNRYLGWPGQAPSYKVGERIWLQAREDAQRRAGAAFDLRAFHRAALDLGSLGLDPLQRALARL